MGKMNEIKEKLKILLILTGYKKHNYKIGSHNNIFFYPIIQLCNNLIY